MFLGHARIIPSGYSAFGVSIFVVLSGFLLANSYNICYILFSMLGARCISRIDKKMTAILKKNFKKLISIVRKENHKGSVI